jgi:hypothetical protein
MPANYTVLRTEEKKKEITTEAEAVEAGGTPEQSVNYK